MWCLDLSTFSSCPFHYCDPTSVLFSVPLFIHSPHISPTCLHPSPLHSPSQPPSHPARQPPSQPAVLLLYKTHRTFPYLVPPHRNTTRGAKHPRSSRRVQSPWQCLCLSVSLWGWTGLGIGWSWEYNKKKSVVWLCGGFRFKNRGLREIGNTTKAMKYKHQRGGGGGGGGG